MASVASDATKYSEHFPSRRHPRLPFRGSHAISTMPGDDAHSRTCGHDTTVAEGSSSLPEPVLHDESLSPPRGAPVRSGHPLLSSPDRASGSATGGKFGRSDDLGLRSRRRSNSASHHDELPASEAAYYSGPENEDEEWIEDGPGASAGSPTKCAGGGDKRPLPLRVPYKLPPCPPDFRERFNIDGDAIGPVFGVVESFDLRTGTGRIKRQDTGTTVTLPSVSKANAFFSLSVCSVHACVD